VIFVRASAPAGGNGSSWAEAYQDFAVALAAAESGKQIWVAQGVYKTSFELKPGVAIYGGFQGIKDNALGDRNPDQYPSVFDGDTNGDDAYPMNISDNAEYIVVAHDVGPTAIFDGFTVRKGGTNDHSDIEIFGDPPSLQNLHIEDDYSYFGAGLWMAGNAVHPARYQNLVFRGNVRDAIHLAGANLDLTCTGCAFVDNNCALYIDGEYGAVRAQVVRSTFHGKGWWIENQAEVIATGPDTIVTVEQATMVGSTNRFIADAQDATVRLVNVVASGYGSSDPIYSHYALWITSTLPQVVSTLELVNSTFFNNNRPQDALVAFPSSGAEQKRLLRVYNSVFDTVGSATSDYEPGTATIEVSHSYTPGLAGVGNVTGDPKLDASGRPQAGSALIDSGALAAPDDLLKDILDLDGDGNVSETLPWDADSHPRVVDYPPLKGGTIDIGAFEVAAP
jgi:hypothetical protein